MTIEKALGELLFELRRKRGLSREQVAEATRVSVQSIGRIERGDVTAPWTSVWALAKFYSVNLDDLLKAAETELEVMREKNAQRRENLRKLGFDVQKT